MKKITACLLLLIVVLALAACGGTPEVNQPEEHIETTPANTDSEPTTYNEEPTTNETNDNGEPYPTPSTQPTGFALVYNNVTIQMDESMDYLLPQLGEPLGMFEAPSCAFDGIDRIFGFPGIQIHTYPDGDQDRVHTISFLNDGITTMSGITLGNSWADVQAAYGNDYEQETGMFTFTIGRTTLSFFIADDMVESIIFGLIMD